MTCVLTLLFRLRANFEVALHTLITTRVTDRNFIMISVWQAVLPGGQCGSEPADLAFINGAQIIPARDGTLRVLRAARDAGVKRVVVTSSFAAIGYRANSLLPL